jgi:YkoY family integral membrane protein
LIGAALLLDAVLTSEGCIIKTLFGQTFNPHDVVVIGLLVLLEGVLSIDNALVIALLAKRLPKHMQQRALTYGLGGAFVFRFIAIGTASYLLRWNIVKLLGGGYLLWISLKHLLTKKPEHEHVTLNAEHTPVLVHTDTGRELSREEQAEELAARTTLPVAVTAGQPGFWSTVAVIEMTDIAFAVDSILAAIAVVGSAPPGHVGPHPKLWVVVVGGILGLILMRVAAALFIKLLERFPRFETSAYLLVVVIGSKLVVDWAANSPEHPHRVNFHDAGSPEFWIFWLLMAVCLGFGFLPKRQQRVAEP